MAFVRYWLPAIVVIGGVFAMVLGPRDSGPEGGAAIVGAGLAIWIINLLFRIGVSGEKDRAEEDSARDYFDQHGHWPDEPAR